MKLKRRLLTGILSASLLFGGMAAAEEIDPGMQEPVSHSYVLKKPIQKPKMDFTIERTGNIGDTKDVTDYSLSKNVLYGFSDQDYRGPNTPELTSEDIIEMDNLITDVRTGDIHSYQEFLDRYILLSENSRISLLSGLGNILYRYNYDSELQYNPVLSQDEFFNILQSSLELYERTGIGTCAHIASHLEQLANDAGIRASEVTGLSRNDIYHAWNVLKTEEGSAVVDSYRILVGGTKNIEKILEAYQKVNGTTAFDHLFFEDTLFRYRLITKEGKDLLNFLGYDESSKTFKDYFVSKDKISSSDLKIILHSEPSLNSLEFNLLGFFAKGGKISEEESSSLREMRAFQAGFDREFSIFDVLKIHPDISFVYSTLSQDKQFEIDELNEIIGANGDLLIKTDMEKGFNVGLRIGGHDSYKIASPLDSYIFIDATVEGAVSYKIPFGKQVSINPYLIAKANLFPKKIDTYLFEPMLTELGGGIPFNAEFKETKISLEPNFSWMMWENKFGVDAEIKSKNFGLKAGGYVTKSNYDFCPDKFGLDVEAEVVLKDPTLKDLALKLSYGLEGTNYDREIGTENKLGISFNLKY